MTDEDRPKVVHLAQVKPGFASGTRAELVDWLRSWADRIEQDDNAKTLLLLVETDAGELYRVSKSTGDLTTASVIGLLAMLQVAILHDGAVHPSLR